MRDRLEEENKSSALFWGSLYNVRVGVSVHERLQNVCVGAQLWVSECGLLHRLRCLHVHACFLRTHLALCLIVCWTSTSVCAFCMHACACVGMQEAMGCTRLSATALLFCSVIGADKEPVTLQFWLVKSGDSASLQTMTLHG